MSLKVIALVSAFNEADIIEKTIGDLVGQGVQVYLLDNGSTDGTSEIVRPWLGRGVLTIETFPAEPSQRFEWRHILARKEELAQALDADWLVHHDADELRESPWPSMSFVEGLELVDKLGWNAVDFAVLNFIPTHDRYRPGDDLRQSFPYFEPGHAFDKLQIKCWKKQPGVDLRSSAGHEARFEGRSVFPLRFLTRHYPFRTQTQAERKVFVERQPRFVPEEIALGWHVQYNAISPGHAFVRDPGTLTEFDPIATRVPLLIRHRDLEEEEACRIKAEHDLQSATLRLGELQLIADELTEGASRLEQGLRQARGQLAEIGRELDERTSERDSLRAGLTASAQRTADLLASWSWRSTAPMRMLYDVVRRLAR